MRITSKGQVTIPQAIREAAGLLPHTEVDFVWDGECVRLEPAGVVESGRGRGARTVTALRGKLRSDWTTETLLALTRSDPERPAGSDGAGAP